MDFQMTHAFLRIPYGIYALVSRQGSQPQAMIVSWVSQVSYFPPLLIVALRHNRPAVPALQEQGIFSLNLLRAAQVPLVNQLKQPLPSANIPHLFEEMRIRTRIYYRLKDTLAWWGCQVTSRIATGDHFLFINEVFSASTEEGKPLVTSDCGKTYIGRS